MQIPNFPQYDFTDEVVTNTTTGKTVTRQINKSTTIGRYKMKDVNGNWRTISHETIAASCGCILQLPKCAKRVAHTTDYFIDTKGNVYSYPAQFPRGIVLKPDTNAKGYLYLNIYYKGKLRNVEVHQLMGVTFLMEDYVERGLVCMHLDDDKTNPALSNLAIGTYSRNNKDAYTRGLNKGNGLKKD